MLQKHYQVTIDNHKIAFALYLNDILLSSNRSHNACHNSFPINQYVYNGENSLRLNLSINPSWTEALSEQWCTIVITEYNGEQGALTPQKICSIDWKWDADAIFPINLYNSFSIDIPYGNWVWLDADTLHEDTLDNNTLQKYISNLYTLMNNKDYQNLEVLLQHKSIDLADAFYIPHSERLADQESFFKNELFSSPGWSLEPLDLSNLMFDFHAENRMVHILKSDGKSPIVATPIDDNIFELELYFCHKNNQWVLCR